MWIEKINIDGFGIFNRPEICDLNPGLIVFYGDNESGKSTLLAFIRAIFFGFPDGRSKEKMYPPLSGGKEGGSLTLVTGAKERYTFERREGPRGGKVTATLPDGSLGGADSLERIFGSVTRDVFRNIFAFSLDELQLYDSIDQSGVRDLIYSAGAGVGRLSYTEINNKLKSRADELLSERGQKQALNILFTELKENRDRQKELQKNIDEFDALHGELDKIKEEIESQEKKEEKISIRHKRAELLLLTWDDWFDLGEYEAELLKLPVIEKFPHDGKARFFKLAEKKSELGESLEEIRDKLKTKEADFSRLSLDENILEQAPQIRELNEASKFISEAQKDLPRIIAEYKSAKEDLLRDVKAIGPDWDEERLGGFDISVSSQEEVRGFLKDIGLAENEEKDAGRDLKSARDRLKETTEKLRTADSGLAQIPEPEEKDSENIRQKQKLISSARINLPRLEERGNRLEIISERLREAENDKGRLRLGESQLLPGWLAPVILLVAAGLGIVFGTSTSVSTGVVAGVVLASVAVLVWSRNKLEAGRLKENKEQEKEYDARIASLKLKDTELCKERDEIGSKIDDIKSELNISGELTADLLIETEYKLNGQLEIISNYQDKTSRLAEAREEEERCKAAAETAQANYDKAAAALSNIRQEFSSWLEQKGLGEALSPAGVLDTFNRIEACRTKSDAVSKLEARIGAMKSAVSNYLELCNKLMAALGNSPVTEEKLLLSINELKLKLDENLDNRKEKDTARKDLERLTGEEKTYAQKLEGVEKDIEELLAAGESADEEEFLRRSEVFENREKLKEDISKFNSNLKRLAGSEEKLVELKKELADSDKQSLESLRDKLEEELAGIKEELNNKRKSWGATDNQIKQLEKSDELSLLRSEEEEKIAELKSHARDWMVLTIARQIMNQAKEKFERERQPGVIKEAGQFFESFTGRRYSSIYYPLDGGSVHVISGQNERRQIEQLSRGTREQLYLALRFGFIKDYNSRAEPLSVVMDDILVNFDPDRADMAVRAISELSRSNQVLIFTCHPETVDLVKKHVPKSLTLKIDGRQFERI